MAIVQKKNPQKYSTIYQNKDKLTQLLIIKYYVNC